MNYDVGKGIESCVYWNIDKSDGIPHRTPYEPRIRWLDRIECVRRTCHSSISFMCNTFTSGDEKWDAALRELSALWTRAINMFTAVITFNKIAISWFVMCCDLTHSATCGELVVHYQLVYCHFYLRLTTTDFSATLRYRRNAFKWSTNNNSGPIEERRKRPFSLVTYLKP